VVDQSPEPGAHDKNALLFTVTLLLTITIFTKINPELKYKIFLEATSPNNLILCPRNFLAAIQLAVSRSDLYFTRYVLCPEMD